MEKQYELLGFIDDDPSRKGEKLNGYPVLGGVEFFENNRGIGVAIALGDPANRIKVIKQLEPFGLHYPNFIHLAVHIGPDVRMGIGNVVCIGSSLAVNIVIGDFCQLNGKMGVWHDCVLGDFATTACGVDFAGYSRIGTGTYFGNHATTLPSVKVGEWSVIGAGAVVNRDIPSGVVAVGVPAKVIKENPEYKLILDGAWSTDDSGVRITG